LHNAFITIINILSTQIAIHSGGKIGADGVWRIADGRKHILLNVTDFGWVIAHTLYVVLNMSLWIYKFIEKYQIL